MNQVWLHHYDAHVKGVLDIPNVTVCDLLKNAAKENPSSIALIDDSTLITYAELFDFANRVARNLNKQGYGYGDRIGVAFTNTPEFVISFFGILHAGAGVAAINPNLVPREQIAQMENVNINGLLADGSVYENIIASNLSLPETISQVFITKKNEAYLNERKVSDAKEKKECNFVSWEDLLVENSAKDEIVVKPEWPAIYQFTGGTTGVPKAAIGLHKNLVANTYQFKTWCDLDQKNPVIMAAIPLYHVYGMVLGMNLAVSLMAPLVLIQNPRDVSNLLKNIEKHSVSFLPGVPSLFNSINQNSDFTSRKFDLSSLKVCISGAASLHEHIARIFLTYAGCNLIQGYGLSEAPTATHCNPVYGKNKTESIGMPLPGVLCRVVDLESGTVDVSRSQPGELLIKAPQVMAGYYQNTSETENVLKDGWLHTGDVVTMDEEGYFYFKERKKDLIKVSGFQVWPHEVERIIREIYGVKDVAVAGVSLNESGEQAIAWVVLDAMSNLKITEIQNQCKKQLASYKIPREFIEINEIPRNATGKVLRRVLVDEYLKKKKTPL